MLNLITKILILHHLYKTTSMGILSGNSKWITIQKLEQVFNYIYGSKEVPQNISFDGQILMILELYYQI